MHHTMTNCVNFIQRFDSTIFRTGQCIQNKFYPHGMFGNIFLQNFLFTVRQSKFQERTLQANFFDTTLCDHFFMIHIKQFILDGRTTAV